MKAEILEHLIRVCVREVLSEIDDETKGAPAPPADGQGTADQPPIPKSEPAPELNNQPPPTQNLKGPIFVNPKDKSKLQKLPISGDINDIAIEKELQKFAASLVGAHAKVASGVAKSVKDAVKNPNASIYIYLGKYDPLSDEVFLMADKSLQIAKDASVSPSQLTGTPMIQTPADYSNPAVPSDQTIAEQQLKAIIKQLVNEILSEK